MKTRTVIFITILMATSLSSCRNQKEWTIPSPSGNISFTLKSGEEGNLKYSISTAGKSILGESPLGIARKDENYVSGLRFSEATIITQASERFELVTGKRRHIESIWNEQIITFRNSNGSPLQLIIRVFDDGAAFRYRFPGNDTSLHTVESELTGFAVPPGSKAWIQPYDKVTTYSPAYETYYEDGIPAGTPAPSSEGWSFPALFSSESGWILITEAAVDQAYAGMHLSQNAESNVYTLRWPEENEANGTCPQKPSSILPWEMPWRVIISSPELAGIAESNIIEKLNPPSLINDPSWIRPGRASWSWWSDWPSPKSVRAQKKFIDFSAEMGWEYTLVDANWDLMDGGGIREVIDYANSKGIGILMWYNSGGPHNSVTERPRDIMSDPVKRRDEFRKLSEWGVKGVKVDFFQSDKQEIIKQYFDILRDAAENRIMVNFHGCTMPRGWNKTWPNLVSMEAVRGAECYAFDQRFPVMAPKHNATLPYTRNAVGSMDYTPVAFSSQKYPHITTSAHELALSVVFESGIVHFADRVEAYRDLPPEPKQFLKEIPVVWDETRLLDGYPGEKCIIARRSGSKWYIGGINGTSQALNWVIDISGLETGSSAITLIEDGLTPSGFSSSSKPAGDGYKLNVAVKPFGGFVAVTSVK